MIIKYMSKKIKLINTLKVGLLYTIHNSYYTIPP